MWRQRNWKRFSKSVRKLGADAVILSERTIQKGGLFRRKPMVEITVGIKEPESGKVEPKGIDSIDPTQTRLRRLERELSELKELVQKLIIAGAPEAETAPPSQAVVAPSEDHPLLRPLLAAGVEPDIARELLRRVPQIPQNAADGRPETHADDPHPDWGHSAPESRTQQVVALVGPTGVGKTTTIARSFAAIHALDYNRRVALLSLDTYRIGAVEQAAHLRQHYEPAVAHRHHPRRGQRGAGTVSGL